MIFQDCLPDSQKRTLGKVMPDCLCRQTGAASAIAIGSRQSRKGDRFRSVLTVPLNFTSGGISHAANCVSGHDDCMSCGSRWRHRSSSQKVFAQTAQPSADSSQSAGKLLTNKLPAGYTIPPQDVPCILPGNRPDIQCLIKNDPDFVRIRDEEAGLEAQALAAAKSGLLDAFHAVETLGALEIFDPKPVRSTTI